MLKQRRKKLVVLTAVADCQLEFHDHRALERQDLERLAPLAGVLAAAVPPAEARDDHRTVRTRASPSSVWRFALVYQGGELAKRKDSRHGESIPDEGPARVAGHAARNCDHGYGAVGLRQLASGEHLTCGEQLSTGEQFNVREQPSACQHGLAQSRTNQVAPPPVSVKPAAPVDGKPVASWKVYWGQKAPKWPPADLVIEIWYKNPGRASTFGGTFTTPILPGQSGSSGRIPHDRSGEVTVVPMINNVDGNVIWAPDPVTISVPPVP